MPKYNEPPTLIEQMKALEARLARMERSSQLANSSVEDGAVLVNNSDGTTTMQIGLQYDGTYAPVVLTSPVPPAPTSPVVVNGVNGIAVQWDGAFASAALCPMDFAYVAVYVGAAGFDPFLTTPVHVFNSPQGGAIFVSLTPGIWQAKLVTRSLAGVPSIASAGVNGTASSTTAAVEFTDGLAPTSSPTPVAVGGVGSFFISWPAISNADPVTYNVYAGTTSGFTANSSSIIGTTDATSLNVKTLTDGTNFAWDTDYYFKVIATDEDGAAASSAVSNAAQMVKITNEYVAATYVYAGEIYANQIRSGTMTADVTVSGSFATAASGQRSVMDGLGFRQFGPDGSSVITDLPNTGNPRFTGIINAFGLIVNGGLEFRGQNNLFAMGSVVTMATTTAGSTISPNITPNWDVVDSGMTEFLFISTGHHREADGGNAVWQCSFFNSSHIHNGPYSYSWPNITYSDGNVTASRIASSTTVVRTATGPRVVTFTDKRVDGQANNLSSVVRGIEVYDVSPMTANGIAPTIKTFQQYGAGYNWYWVGCLIGRCFSPVGQSALENQIALVEHKRDITPDQLYLKRYEISDTAVTQQGTTVQVASPIDGDDNEAILGVNYGSSGKMGFPGTEQNIWVVFTRAKAVAYSATGTRLPDLDFPLAPDAERVDAVGSTAAGANGFVRFESVARNNPTLLPATRYENIHWDSTSSSIWWAAYTWYDSVGTTHESDMSSINTTTMPKRMRYTLTAPNLPDPAAGAGTTPQADDVNSVRFYMARQATQPTRTEMWKQTTQPADGVTSITYATLPQFSGTSNPPAATDFPAQAASKFQSSAVGADGLPKVLITGDGLLHGESLDVSGVGSAALSGKAFEQLYYSVRSQALLTGGGVLTVSATYYVKWSAPFRPTSLGRGSNTATAGYFEISMPAVSTTVNGYGGATNKTVTSDGIPLADWDALYYVLPYGSTFTSLAANFRVVNLSSDFTVPNDWVLICIKNATSSRIEFTTGDKVPAGAIGGGSIFQGPITCTYGSGFTYASSSTDDPPRVYAEGNWAYVSGRVRRSSGTGTVAFVIPSGYRPRSEIIRAYLGVFALGGANAEGPTFVGDIDPATGNVELRNTTTVSWTTNTWLSIFGSYPRTLT